MRELVYVYWPDCAKCHTARPRVEKWCEKNWYKFVPMQYADSWLEITSIPTAILDRGDDTEILDFEGIMTLISNSYQDDNWQN